MTALMLEQLEAQLATLPAGSTKHEMEPGFDVMAQWIQTLDERRRAEVLADLPMWLEEDHPWHSRAVMELALRLQARPLLEAAVREAGRRGVRDIAAGQEYPPWLIFHLNLLSTVSRWQEDPGPSVRAYLSRLRAGVAAPSYSRRLLAIRAWFTECLRTKAKHRRKCLRQALKELRRWRDVRLLRSGLSLLHVYFASTPEGVADLKEVLTAQEFAMACPELVAC